MMIGFNHGVESLLKFIKENSIGAEIGVWKGETSRRFLSRKPMHVDLVDPWSVEPYLPESEWGRYSKRYSVLVGGSEPEDFMLFYNRLFEQIQEKLGGLYNVTVHRMYSNEYFKSCKEDALDWIYVDGDHGYEGCLEDLRQSRRVVKTGGNILGDDYPNKKGVKQAVDQFIEENNLTLELHGINQFRIRNS